MLEQCFHLTLGVLEQCLHLTLGGGIARQEACTLSWPGAGGPNWLLSLGQGTRLLVTAISQPPYDQDYHQTPVMASLVLASRLMAYGRLAHDQDYYTWVMASLLMDSKLIIGLLPVHL